MSKSKRVICEKDEKFVYIPIIESLKQILTNGRISGMVLRKPKCCDKGVFYDVQDGSIYQDDKYFEEHENTLCIVLYHDELEVCNPLGSNAGVHKLDMYYFTIANLCPKFRSKRCAVHLFAIANADLVKKYSIDTIMQPLLDDLNVLYRGCNMIVDGVEKVIHGKVLMCTGDTLGQHYWGGYKKVLEQRFRSVVTVNVHLNKCKQTSLKKRLLYAQKRHTVLSAMPLNRHQLHLFRKIYKQLMGLHEEVYFASYLHLM